MRESKISVIIPVHNVVRYLPECIDSVRNQTYSNLEIILVDDGSTDGSGEVCDRYKKKDERVQVIHQDYQGVSSARNAGLNAVTGSLVGFIDSDDWIDPDYYEVLETCMQKTCADIVVSGCYYVYQDAVQKDERNAQRVLYDRLGGLKALSRRKMRYTVWDKLYRKSLFSGISFVEGRTYEDVLATYQLISRAECIVCTNYYGYHQRKRVGSITHHLGGMIEGFPAHYEVWQDAINQKTSNIFKRRLSTVSLRRWLSWRILFYFSILLHVERIDPIYFHKLKTSGKKTSEKSLLSTASCG